jgi:hypothetical protein
MIGYDREELSELIPWDAHPVHEMPRVEEVSDCLQRGECVSANAIQVVCKDRSIFLANIKTSMLEMDGRPDRRLSLLARKAGSTCTIDIDR